MSLCRHYVRELRRSVLIETPELEKGSKRSSVFLDQLTDPNNGAGGEKEDVATRDQNLSAFLRQEAHNHSPQGSLGSQQSGERGSGERGPNGERMPRASFMSNALEGHTTDSNSPAHTVARQDLRVSAEKILYTYLLPNSEREIILPQGMINDIIVSIEEDMRDDPEVFDAAKDYTFQAMERDAFPGFLRSKALGNLVPPSIKARMVIGLLGMFGGFWAGFACIFLDKPKHIRCWVSILILTPCYSQLTLFSADPTLHHWRLCAGLPTISYRSRPCAPGLQRVHVYELCSNQRALCSSSPQQTRSHGAGLHDSRWCGYHNTLHICAWQGTLMAPIIVKFTC
jgi:hypothetical protein